MSGPLLKKRNADGTKGSSILGYFISGELRSVDDNDPSAIGMWKVKDDVLADLKVNPFVLAPNANAGLLSSSEFLNENDFELVDAKQKNCVFKDPPRKTMQNHLEITSTSQFWTRNVRN